MAATLEQAFLNAGFAPVKPRKQRERKTQKCHRCSAPMEYVEGANVMVCTGDIEVKDDEGNPRTVACGHRFIFDKR